MSSTKSLQNGIDTLRATVIEGRTESVRHRQNELHSMYSALLENSNLIRDAISKDSEVSAAEANREYLLAMDASVKIYETLDFDQSITNEYSIKECRDNQMRRIGAGIVLIRPTTHTRFYSLITPLVAAIAAGNCTLLEFEQPHSAVDNILIDLLSSALDRGTFLFSKVRLEKCQLSQIDLFVDQTSTATTHASNELLSKSNARSLAVVDRTADIRHAANAIVRARLPPHNTSPYAPDLVIVNNFILQDFVKACFENAEGITVSNSLEQNVSSDTKLKDLIRECENRGQLKVHRSNTSQLQVVVVQDHSSQLLNIKIGGPYIFVLLSTSTTDTITSQSSSPIFLATYNFAAPSLCKYLSQSLPSHTSFANHIPSSLLYGPASPSPSTYPLAIHPRYTPEMFSVPRPEFFTQVEFSTELKNLKPTGQKKGHAVGFFEQGIFIGLGLTGSVVLPLLGWG
ncbi:Aldehyde dehydrogenase family 3 member B2, partial [Lachnellula suecica]